jgi:type IV pilus assembly protein PilB
MDDDKSRSNFRRSGAGALLVRETSLSQDVKKVQETQKKEGGRLGKHLAKQGLIDESELATFLSNQYKVPAVALSDFDIEDDVLSLVSVDVVQKHQSMPLSRVGNTLIVAMVDPSNIYAIDDLKFITGYNIDIVVTTEASFQQALEKYYETSVPETEDSSSVPIDLDYNNIMEELSDDEVEYVEAKDDGTNILDLERSAEDAPVIRLVNLVLLDAIRKGASDIHVEPYEKEMRVRYRIDGVLYEVMKPPYKLKNSITSRLKVMSRLDIAERRLPQDGRIKLRIGKDREMDFRVSTLPTLFGEKTVLRLLDKSNLQLDMKVLGFEEGQLRHFQEAISRPYGMVLVTGPTGSGKTTTLYSALSELNKPGVNISTSEDPVEYNLMGINQVQMHEDIGLNFSASLRSFLRQDPDIIMVGEIRDFETAEIAVKAALTGHLVLSTLHTNDAPSTINRLLNMGIEPFLVTASVNLVAAQRLGRRVCSQCKVPVKIIDKVLLNLGVPEEEIGTFQIYEGQGCEKCTGTGYKGRIAFYEIMPMYDELKDMVLTGASNSELKATAIRHGMRSLRMSAIERLKAGMTSIDEVLRNTAPDEF